jgi:hypothetical protein
MPEDNPARKSFEADARTARSGGKKAEQSYAAIADGIREFSAKLLDLDIAQANTMAGMNFVSELTADGGFLSCGRARSEPSPIPARERSVSH